MSLRLLRFKLAMNKKCTKCKKTKPLNEEFFRFRKKRNRWVAKCLECLKEDKKAYYQKNKEKILSQNKNYRDKNQDNLKNYFANYYKNNKNDINQRQKEYVKNNSDKIAKYKKEYYLQNKEKITTKNQNYYKKNKNKIIKNSQSWVQKNKEHRRAYEKKYRKEKRKNPLVKMKETISAQIRNALKRKASSKRGDSVLDYLPYSLNDLKNYLESQFEYWMSWENWGVYNSNTWDDNDPSTWTWQIDHIIPHSSFEYLSMNDEGFLKCWSLNNLRPLSAKENIKLGNKGVNHDGAPKAVEVQVSE